MNLSREAAAAGSPPPSLASNWTSDSAPESSRFSFRGVSTCFAACKTPGCRGRSTENWNAPASPEVSLCCEARDTTKMSRRVRNPGGNVSITTFDVGSIAKQRNRVPANFRAETFRGKPIFPARAISNDCAFAALFHGK